MMTAISLLDSAIKSFVEIPKKLHGRITYTRTQLLSYRFCQTAQAWPPVFDRRFAKSKLRRISYLNSGLNRSSENREVNRTAGSGIQDKAVINTRPELEKFSKKDRKFYDEAIVSAELYPHNFRERNFYDRPNLSSAQGYGRSKYSNQPEGQPEWYIYGPDDVEEEMDHYGYDMSAGDDEKENNIIQKRLSQKVSNSTSSRANHPNEVDSLNKNCHSASKNEYYPRGDRPPNIKTLREIESKLRVQHVDPKAPADMSAYYKLLGLVGNAVRSSNEGASPGGGSHKSTNNNQPRAASSELPEHSTALSQLYADPAVSEVVDSNLSKMLPKSLTLRGVDEPENKSNMSKSRVYDRLDDPAAVTCNPISASYQRQVMASGPLGQNALRWFKAMTNAASANACISQHLDRSSQYAPESEKLSDKDTLQSASNDRRNFSSEAYLSHDPNMEPQVSEMGCDQINENGGFNMKPTFNTQVQVRPPTDHQLSHGIGLNGGNFPLRPMKPLLFYYPPHTGHLFGRPMMNSLLLHQLLQYQVGLRTLQMPLNYLRTQPVLPTLGGNPYLSVFHYPTEQKTATVRDNAYLHDSVHEVTSSAPVQTAQEE